MTIRPFDPLRFFVSSENPKTPGVEYLVDVSEPTKQFPFGKCTCPQFQIRIEAAILHDESPPALRCKHQTAVYEMLLRKLSSASKPPAVARRASSAGKAPATGRRASGSATRSTAAVRARSPKAAQKSA